LEKHEVSTFLNLIFFFKPLPFLNEKKKKATVTSNIPFGRFFAELSNGHGFFMVQAHS